MDSKKGRNILPQEPSGADRLRLHLACPQNNPPLIPFSAPRGSFSENMRYPDPALSTWVKVLRGKNFRWKTHEIASLRFTVFIHGRTHGRRFQGDGSADPKLGFYFI